MKKKNILVIGNFGYKSNQLDGQTIKTRNIYDLLKLKEKNYKVNYYNTEILSKQISVLYNFFKSILLADIIINVGAGNNLRTLFPLLYYLCKLKGCPLHFVVVGGWLDKFFDKHPFHFKLFKKIDGIYPQTNDLVEILSNKYALKNVYLLNNFRMSNYNNKSKNIIDDWQIRLVFMARIHPKKGISTLFNLDKKLKELNIDNVTIDLYGQINDSFKNEFEQNIKNCSYTQYKGVLNPNEIHNTLSKYDLMLFPTEYYTEGFPGSILDAYIAGIPVIATKWMYADEFIDNNKSGIITKFEDNVGFVDTVIENIKNTTLLKNMQEEVISYSEKYSPEFAWKVLKEKLKI